MPQNIRLKRTNVAGRTGSDASLLTGELAMNTADGLIWGKGTNVFEIITENRVYSPVNTTNKIVTQAELEQMVVDYKLNNVVTNDQDTLPEAQNFISDGSTTEYTLSNAPASDEAVDLYVDEVLQRPGEVFVISGTTLTFLHTPPSGSDIYVKYRYPFATIIDNPDSSIENRHLNLTYTSTQSTSNGSQVAYAIPPGHNEHSVLVIINGLVQPPENYTVNGTTLTLSQSPMVGSVVDFRYMPV